ncbi:nucleotide exchange factor GrpE [Pelagibaculum spongiae]|uniref:Protein GrpE n=1 Tax=Pelagibaculum spongiae TaxID=2080658 RepID=A0A2V1GXV8_9GAMM|nr:nucleotide exchange factor GrpE [Pelagibaculum spongiae]PVZ71991.1 nucleotide exchange factor GrpE [Pelagibaculum spongiae]
MNDKTEAQQEQSIENEAQQPEQVVEAEIEVETVAEQAESAEVDLQGQLMAAQKKAQENWDLALRAQAEMENIKRRAERDVANAHKFALDKFVGSLLPVVDSLEKALESIAEDDEANKAIREGTEMTLKMFTDSLSKFGVVQINPVSEVFNPERHEAMAMQEVAGSEANTVLFVIQKGYLLNERLVRPARVMVAK